MTEPRANMGAALGGERAVAGRSGDLGGATALCATRTSRMRFPPASRRRGASSPPIRRPRLSLRIAALALMAVLSWDVRRLSAALRPVASPLAGERRDAGDGIVIRCGHETRAFERRCNRRIKRKMGNRREPASANAPDPGARIRVHRVSLMGRRANDRFRTTARTTASMARVPPQVRPMPSPSAAADPERAFPPS